MPANVSTLAASRREIALVPPSRYSIGFLYGLGLVFSAVFFYLYVSSTDGLAPDKARAQLPGLLLMSMRRRASVSISGLKCVLPTSAVR